MKSTKELEHQIRESTTAQALAGDDYVSPSLPIYLNSLLHRHGLTLRDRHPLGHRERIGRLRQRQDYVGITRHQPLLIAWKPLP